MPFAARFRFEWVRRAALLTTLFAILGHAPPALAQARGTISLAVDATDAARKIFHTRLVIPAEAGPLSLSYPKWLPGEHGPTGPLTDVAGLRITAGGQALAWQRDLVDMYAVHCTVPPGAKSQAFF